MFQNEIHGLIEKYSVNESLVEEVERLREENRRLKTNYWLSHSEHVQLCCPQSSPSSWTVSLLQQGYICLTHGQGMWFESVDGSLLTWGQKVFSQNRAEVENTAFLLPSLLPADWRGQTESCFIFSITASIRQTVVAEHQQCLLVLTTTAASQIWVKLFVL